MGEKLVIGPINAGLRNNRTAFVIDNDSFPQLVNAYQWRGRVKRKRGTSLVGRLRRIFTIPAGINLSRNATTLLGLTGFTPRSIEITGITNATQAVVTYTVTTGSYAIGETVYISGVTGMTEINNRYYQVTNIGVGTVTLNVNSTTFGVYGAGSGFISLAGTASIVPGSVSIVNGGNRYTDSNGVLTGVPSGTGTIVYTTGLITINGGVGNVVGSFSFYPGLPVMGLEDFSFNDNSFPRTIGFDTQKAYNISTAFPYPITNTTFYNNPVTATYTGYTQKTAWTEFNWNGEDYQQFWTTNYQGVLWATNGIDVPFTGTNIGMQFKAITVVDNITAGPPAFADLTFGSNHGLSVGDFLFINEVVTTTGINWQTGYVTSIVSATKVRVEFPNATITTNGTGGIAQYLTRNSDDTKDCIRWYNGDSINGTVTGLGWVNFMPPLSQQVFSIADEPEAIYYLVGARIIVPFKDRLLFFGPVIQSSTGTPRYLQDTVIYSQNGTPYYTCSYTNTPSSTVDTPTSATNVFFPILTPTDQSATPYSFFEDSTGFGGFISSGLNQPILSVSPNEDVLLVGFNPNYQTRLAYTGNDIVPFNFFVVNSELGTSSTFSSVTLDEGVISKGPRGFTIASQTNVQRIDLEIPDEVFQVSLVINGNERLCAQRDFINEWIYFTYPSNIFNYDRAASFPNTTLMYNYRDNSWAKFYESYTTYGIFRPRTGFTWATVGSVYTTWGSWSAPWNAGSSTLLQPQVIGGNQQGFVLIRDNGTSEATSISIQGFTGNTVTSPDHGLNDDDYILITGCVGTISSLVNGKVFKVFNTNQNTFQLDPVISSSGTTYIGGGYITRYYVPFIQTKQFPMSWGLSKKTRLGVQRYLLSTTSRSQVTLLIFLSQDGDDPYNDGRIVPDANSNNNGLVYSTVLYTCPESTNLGLTPANVNLLQLNEVSSSGDGRNGQQQIWHRVNTSLIGDTVQMAITMSDEQMRDVNLENQVAEIELHSIIIDVSPSMELA